MKELLQDVDKSIQNVTEVRSALHQQSPPFAHLSSTQSQRITGRVDDAYQAVLDLQHTLEPLFRDQNASTRSWATKTWRSVVSISMESEIAKRLDRIQRLNQEMLGEMQIVGLQLQYNTEYAFSDNCVSLSLTCSQ